MITSAYAVALYSCCLVVTRTHGIRATADSSHRVCFLSCNLIASLNKFCLTLLLSLINLCLRVDFWGIWMFQRLFTWNIRFILNQCLCFSRSSFVLLWGDTLLLNKLNSFVVLNLHLPLCAQWGHFGLVWRLVSVGSCHVMLLGCWVYLLVLIQMVRLQFIWIIFLLNHWLRTICCIYSINILVITNLHLVRKLRFYQIHLWTKLSCLL